MALAGAGRSAGLSGAMASRAAARWRGCPGRGAVARRSWRRRGTPRQGRPAQCRSRPVARRRPPHARAMRHRSVGNHRDGSPAAVFLNPGGSDDRSLHSAVLAPCPDAAGRGFALLAGLEAAVRGLLISVCRWRSTTHWAMRRVSLIYFIDGRSPRLVWGLMVPWATPHHPAPLGLYAGDRALSVRAWCWRSSAGRWHCRWRCC